MGGGDLWTNKKCSRFGGRFDRYKINKIDLTGDGEYGRDARHWDITPPHEYFIELFRVMSYFSATGRPGAMRGNSPI